MVVKEKSEKYKSDFKKWDHDEKMKNHHYLQKGIMKTSSSSPPPLWGQNRYLMSVFGGRGGGCSPFAPGTHSQAHTALPPCQPGSGVSHRAPQSCPNTPVWTLQMTSRDTSSPLLMHCLPLFQIFNLKVYWDKGGYLLVDWLLRSYQRKFQHHKWKCEKLTYRNKPVED